MLSVAANNIAIAVAAIFLLLLSAVADNITAVVATILLLFLFVAANNIALVVAAIWLLFGGDRCRLRCLRCCYPLVLPALMTSHVVLEPSDRKIYFRELLGDGGAGALLFLR